MLERLQTAARRHLPEWTLVAVGLGFLVVLAELLLTGHTKDEQVLGVAAALLGVGLAVAGLVTRGKPSAWVGMLMLVLSVSGLIGLASHAENRAEGAVGQARFERFERAEQDRLEMFGTSGRSEAGRALRPRRREVPPPLAPLSLSGLALMGAAAAWAREPQGPGKS